MRSEEEKTEDILFYEKKAKARELLGCFKKKLRIIRVMCVMITAAAALYPIILAYDSGKLWILLATAAAAAVFALTVFFVCGAAVCRSLSKFLKWHRLTVKFEGAEDDMKRLEEKFLDGTAFEPEVDATEDLILKLADEILKLGE